MQVLRKAPETPMEKLVMLIQDTEQTADEVVERLILNFELSTDTPKEEVVALIDTLLSNTREYRPAIYARMAQAAKPVPA